MSDLRRFILVLLLLSIGGAVWGAIYVQRKGFSKTWRGLIEEEFTKRGYHIKIGMVTLGPFQGLVAEDVYFYQDPQKKEEIANVDNVILDLDLTQVLKRDLSINTLDVQDASLSLPLTPGKRDSEMLRVDHFNGRLVVTESQIEIVKARADLQGIDVTITGSLHRPPMESAKGEDVDQSEQRRKLRQLGKRLDLLQNVLHQIDLVEFDVGKPPRLAIEFSGDLGNLDDLRASARLTAGDFRRGSYAAQSLSASLELDGAKGRANLKELHLRDSRGDFRLRAEWPLDKREIIFDLESTADLPALAASIFPNPRLGEVVFFEPPLLKMEGVYQIDEAGEFEFPKLPIEAIGHFQCDRLGSRGVVFDGLEFDFSVSDDHYYVRNLGLSHKSGTLFANLMFDPALGEKTFRYQWEMKLDPKAFTPFFQDEESQRFLSRWDFGRESNIYIAAIGSGPDFNPVNWSSQGVIDLRNFRLNKVPFEQLETDYESDGREQTYRNVRMTRPEGEVTAEEAVHNDATKQWHISRMHWSIDLVEGTRAFSPGLFDQVKRFRFSKRPEITLNGIVDTRRQEALSDGGRRHDFELAFRSDAPVEYDFLGQNLPLESPSGTLKVKEAGVHLSNFEAGLFGGDLTADFKATNLDTSKNFDATYALEKVSFPGLTRLFTENENTEGDLSGRMEFSGTLGDVRSLNGFGVAVVRDCDVFTIPSFEPLSKLIRFVIPSKEAGFGMAEEATASLTLKNGILSTDDLQALTDTFQFEGSGHIDCADQTIDFNAAFNTRFAAAQKLLSTDSKLLEFSGSGPIGDPKWKLKIEDALQPPADDSGRKDDNR